MLQFKQIELKVQPTQAFQLPEGAKVVSIDTDSRGRVILTYLGNTSMDAVSHEVRLYRPETVEGLIGQPINAQDVAGARLWRTPIRITADQARALNLPQVDPSADVVEFYAFLR